MTFQVGNIITAQRKGYHVITEINGYDIAGDFHVFITYRTIAQRDFKPVNNSPEFVCSANWCRVVRSQEIEDRIRLVDTWGGDLLQQVVQSNE